MTDLLGNDTIEAIEKRIGKWPMTTTLLVLVLAAVITGGGIIVSGLRQSFTSLRPYLPQIELNETVFGVANGVVARIVTGPHDVHRQDPHRPMRYDTGRPRAVIRLRISQPRTTSLPCPAGLRARRPSPMMDL